MHPLLCDHHAPVSLLLPSQIFSSIATTSSVLIRSLWTFWSVLQWKHLHHLSVLCQLHRLLTLLAELTLHVAGEAMRCEFLSRTGFFTHSCPFPATGWDSPVLITCLLVSDACVHSLTVLLPPSTSHSFKFDYRSASFFWSCLLWLIWLWRGDPGPPKCSRSRCLVDVNTLMMGTVGLG
jgi:hypothetical protein